MRKHYESKPEVPYLYKTCECSHSWGNHGHRGWLDWYSDGPCEKCECPRYKLHGMLTWEQLKEFEKR